VVRDDDRLALVAEHRPPIALRPLEQVLAWDLTARRPRAATAEERAAFGHLADGDTAQITGTLTKCGENWSLAVREVRNARPSV